MMSQTCRQLGMNGETHIHGVGNGAVWIADQYEEQFGMNHDCYLDFYHAYEYLAKASKSIIKNSPSELSASQWLNLAKTMLKDGELETLIDKLGLAGKEFKACGVKLFEQY